MSSCEGSSPTWKRETRRAKSMSGARTMSPVAVADTPATRGLHRKSFTQLCKTPFHCVVLTGLSGAHPWKAFMQPYMLGAKAIQDAYTAFIAFHQHLNRAVPRLISMRALIVTCLKRCTKRW